MQEERDIMCPYCWQHWTVLFDLTIPAQTYIEDCAVCCNPVVITYEADGDSIIHVDTERSE